MWRGVFWVLWGVAIASWFLLGGRIRTDPSQNTDLRPYFNLNVGGSRSFLLGGEAMTIEVPPGPEQSHSIGTFLIRSDDGKRGWGPVSRDGTVENAFIADFTGDGNQDAVFVCRSAGSGGYVSLHALVSQSDGWELVALNDLASEQMDGYMGHDSVYASDDRLYRVFPTYEDEGLRVDRQWTPDQLREGDGPLKTDADSNADPSGANRRFEYHWSLGQWVRVP